jgi:hypothetical protein
MFKLVSEANNEVLQRFVIQDPERLPLIADELGSSVGERRSDLIARFSHIASNIRTTGTWKVTRPGRLPETERAVQTYLEPNRPTIRLLDVGSSTGATSFDLFESLRRAFDRRVHVDILELYGYLQRLTYGPLVEYRVLGDVPILARVGALGLRLSIPDGARPLTRELVDAYLSLDDLRDHLSPSGRISLFDPRVEESDDFTVHEGSCLARRDAFVARFDVIRASNILNLSYFSRDQLRGAIGYLGEYLTDGGCLVISRNLMEVDDGIEQGTIWRKAGPTLRKLDDFGGGSEVESLIEGDRLSLATDDRSAS